MNLIAFSRCARLCLVAPALLLAACSESDGASGGAGASSSGAPGSAGSSVGGAGASSAGSSAQGGAGAAGIAGAAGSSIGGSGGIAGSAAGATTGGAASGVECAAGNVCDGFETYKSGAGFGDWKPNGTSGKLDVDALHVFSGMQAAHFEINAGANQRLQLERTGAPLFPAQNNAFWGRVMVWASDLPLLSNTENKNVHYDVIQASGATPGEYRIAGMGNVLLNYEPHDCYYGTDKKIPEDRWACWEWLYDGQKNVIEFYIDGALQARVESKGQGCVDGTSSVWQAPEFSKLRIGFVNYQSKADPTDVWMDDFAAGPARIGCPALPTSAH